MTEILRTPRLELAPMTEAVVEAVLLGRRDEAERLVDARMPDRWPNPELIERAFSMSLEAVRAAPGRLWGGRVMILPSPSRRVVGSVVFRGEPDASGICEIAYGVEEGSQGRGFATEAVSACVLWALGDERVRAVQAATFAWHHASVRVLTKVGMSRVTAREHETMGEMVVFERRKHGRPAYREP